MKNKKNLTEAEKLKTKITALRQQLKALQELKDSIRTIKAGTIDALVIPDKKDIKIFTSKTADKTYRILIEKMNEGAVTLNENGTIIYCNSHFATMVNLPLQKVIGTKFKKFIGDSKRKHFNELVKQAREGAIKTEMCIYPAQGNEIPVQMAITDLNLDDTFALSIIITDLTEQYKNQEKLRIRSKQLEQKNKELEKVNADLVSFTYVASHDLQEPLRKIQNFSIAILLEEEKNLSESGKRYFQQMQKTANRMQSLIEDLLTYSRVKDTNIVFEKTNLNSILDELLKDFEEDIKKKEVVLKIKPLGTVKVIPFQFRQLLQNLISNSLKFSNTEKTPKIIIESELIEGDKLINKNLINNQKYLHIIFEDNGIGFDPQYKDKIFEVFQRLHTIDKYKGTGIGLAICKRIVENHHGAITATGALGKGARFDIYIPV